MTCSMVVEIRAPSCPMKKSFVEITLAASEPLGKIKLDNRGKVL